MKPGGVANEPVGEVLQTGGHGRAVVCLEEGDVDDGGGLIEGGDEGIGAGATESDDLLLPAEVRGAEVSAGPQARADFEEHESVWAPARSEEGIEQGRCQRWGGADPVGAGAVELDEDDVVGVEDVVPGVGGVGATGELHETIGEVVLEEGGLDDSDGDQALVGDPDDAGPGEGGRRGRRERRRGGRAVDGEASARRLGGDGEGGGEALFEEVAAGLRRAGLICYRDVGWLWHWLLFERGGILLKNLSQNRGTGVPPVLILRPEACATRGLGTGSNGRCRPSGPGRIAIECPWAAHRGLSTVGAADWTRSEATDDKDGIGAL